MVSHKCNNMEEYENIKNIKQKTKDNFCRIPIKTSIIGKILGTKSGLVTETGEIEKGRYLLKQKNYWSS